MYTNSTRQFARLILVALTLIAFTQTVPVHADKMLTMPAPKFQIIRMVSSVNGWAVTTVPNPKGTQKTDNRQIFPGTIGSVLHTQDAGRTWIDVTPQMPDDLLSNAALGCDCTDNALAGFFFLDDTHVWIATSDALITGNQDFPGINVLRTSDGGHSWQRTKAGINAPFIVTFSFIDAQHGWLLAGDISSMLTPDQSALLYQTNDGGATWQLIADDGVYEHDHADHRGSVAPMNAAETGVTPYKHDQMIFESARSGWMTAWRETGSAADGGVLLHTIDAGKNWHRVNLLSTQPMTEVMYLCTLSGLNVFAPGSITLLSSCYDENTQLWQVLMHQTNDDGETWQHYPILANLLCANGLLQVLMISPTRGWSTGCDVSTDATPYGGNPLNAFAFYRTVDAGKSWAKMALVPDALRPRPGEYGQLIAGKFDFINDHIGWAIDPTGNLFATTDGSVTWTALPLKIASRAH